MWWAHSSSPGVPLALYLGLENSSHQKRLKAYQYSLGHPGEIYLVKHGSMHGMQPPALASVHCRPQMCSPLLSGGPIVTMVSNRDYAPASSNNASRSFKNSSGDSFGPL
jgi:hypothetical protein